MPPGTEVCLGPGHSVTWGPVPPKKGAQQPPPPNGCPSQLLLSSCSKWRPPASQLCRGIMILKTKFKVKKSAWKSVQNSQKSCAEFASYAHRIFLFLMQNSDNPNGNHGNCCGNWENFTVIPQEQLWQMTKVWQQQFWNNNAYLDCLQHDTIWTRHSLTFRIRTMSSYIGVDASL